MNYAYVTLATTKKFLIEAKYLQASLRLNKSKYKLIIMISEELEEEKELLQFFDEVIVIPLTTFFYKHEKIERYKNTINKFYAYNFTNYDKLLFIDADIILVKNVDDVFNLTSELVVSTYSPKKIEKGLDYPLNGFMLLTPEEGKYDFLLDFSKTASTIVDDEALLYNLYLDNFNNKNWNDKINTFENLGYNKGLIFFHNNNIFYHWILVMNKVTPEKFYLLNPKFLTSFLIEIYRQMIDAHAGIQLSTDELLKKFEEIGSLKYYNRNKFFKNLTF